MRRLAVAVAGLAFWMGFAHANEFTRNSLFELCTKYGTDGEALCDMWMNGFNAGVFGSQANCQREKEDR